MAGTGTFIVLRHDLESENEGPDETEDELDLAIVNIYRKKVRN